MKELKEGKGDLYGRCSDVQLVVLFGMIMRMMMRMIP